MFEYDCVSEEFIDRELKLAIYVSFSVKPDFDVLKSAQNHMMTVFFFCAQALKPQNFRALTGYNVAKNRAPTALNTTCTYVFYTMAV